jgi:hypothetical protein
VSAEDSTKVVNGLPDEPARILALQVHPYPDGQRVRLHVSLTAFQVPPNLEAEILRPDGLLVSSTYLVAAEGPEVEITLHLKDEARPGTLVARVILDQSDQGTQDVCEAPFEIPPPETYY